MTALMAFWRNETPEPPPMRRPRRCASPTAYPLRPIDRFRTFQIAGGIFLAAYLLGHMNSAFVFARSISASTATGPSPRRRPGWLRTPGILA